MVRVDHRVRRWINRLINLRCPLRGCVDQAEATGYDADDDEREDKVGVKESIEHGSDLFLRVRIQELGSGLDGRGRQLLQSDRPDVRLTFGGDGVVVPDNGSASMRATELVRMNGFVVALRGTLGDQGFVAELIDEQVQLVLVHLHEGRELHQRAEVALCVNEFLLRQHL